MPIGQRQPGRYRAPAAGAGGVRPSSGVGPPRGRPGGRSGRRFGGVTGGETVVGGAWRELLGPAGAAGEQVEAVDRDTRFEAAGVAVRAIAGTHAAIHPAVPDLTNVAYLVADRLLHPGDAFPAVPDAPALEVMFLPVSGPWMRFADAADYVAALHPGIVVPIHDGDLNDVGRTLTDQLSGLLGDVRYERLSDGRTLTV